MYNNFLETFFGELNDFVGNGVSSSRREYGKGLECECNENTYKNCNCEETLKKVDNFGWQTNSDNSGYYLNQEVPCGKEDCGIEVVDSKYVKITYRMEQKYESNGFSHTCNRNGVFKLTLPSDADASTLKATYDNKIIHFTVEKVKEAPEGTVKIELN